MKKILKNNEDDLYRMRSIKLKDGTIAFIDTGTRATKKNRHRHIKDGCPKSERGKRMITDDFEVFDEDS